MSDFVLSCESTADRSLDFFKRRNIRYICSTTKSTAWCISMICISRFLPMRFLRT